MNFFIALTLVGCIALFGLGESANIFKTYRKENNDHRDLPVQLTGKQVLPINKERTWSKADANKENVASFFRQGVTELGLIESDDVRNFASQTAEWATESRSYDTIWTVIEIRPNTQATVVYALVGAKRSPDGQLQVSFGGLYATANIIAKRKIIHHHSKRKWRLGWKTIRWTTESEEDRGITPAEATSIHQQLLDAIRASPEFRNLPVAH